MTYTEMQARFKIKEIIDNRVMSKMMNLEYDGKDPHHGTTNVYVPSTVWDNVKNKAIVVRKISRYMKESGFVGKWIDQNNIFVKW